MNTIALKEIFDIRYGNSLALSDLNKDNNGVPFISRTEKNNGLSANVKLHDQYILNPKNTISVAVSGSVMSCFLQTKAYYTGYHILVLHPKIKFTYNEMLYYCMCLRANRYKYSFGRQANKTLNDLLVPAISSIPHWINTVKIKKPSKKSVINKKLELNIHAWQSFELSNLFTITGSKTTSILKLKEHGLGKYPYVTTQATNNAVNGFYDFYTEEGGCLVIESAVLGYCSYQKNNFSASDHVEKLIPKFKLNKYIALFLTTVFNLEQYRYGYGRGFSQERIKQTKIKLPTKNKQADWQFMENYIKSLPYSKSL